MFLSLFLRYYMNLKQTVCFHIVSQNNNYRLSIHFHRSYHSFEVTKLYHVFFKCYFVYFIYMNNLDFDFEVAFIPSQFHKAHVYFN